MIRTALVVLAALFALVSEPAAPSASSPAPQGPVNPARALVLIGGEYHAVETNSRLVIDMLKAQGLNFAKVDIFRIDAPPPGKPGAEKATSPANPDLLKDPDLNKKYDIIFQYTQDSYIEGLTAEHVDGILHFVRSGGGWIGWHSASDTFKGFPEYVRMVGGKFETHPAYGPVHIQRVATQSPAGDGVDDFDTNDELYHLNDASSADKDMLLVARSPGDQKTRPVAWTKRYGMGKVFYTVLGHGPDVYKNSMFQKMMFNAATWALQKGNGASVDGSTILFNNHDLEGWAMSGPGRFTVENGEIVTSGGMGLLWYERKSFGDFALELQWKVGRKEDNSGVFVRFPAPANPWTAVYQGYEIQIGDTFDDKHNTGSVYDFKGPTKLPTKPVGEWNQYRIEVRGQNYTIFVNGEKVNEFKGDRSLEGHIGLQNHDDTSKVRFRNIRIAELK